MFQYPVTEIYSATGERACVFSTEEHAAKLAEGWLEERPAPDSANAGAQGGVLEQWDNKLRDLVAPTPKRRKK